MVCMKIREKRVPRMAGVEIITKKQDNGGLTITLSSNSIYAKFSLVESLIEEIVEELQEIEIVPKEESEIFELFLHDMILISDQIIDIGNSLACAPQNANLLFFYGGK